MRRFAVVILTFLMVAGPSFGKTHKDIGGLSSAGYPSLAVSETRTVSRALSSAAQFIVDSLARGERGGQTAKHK
jgi:hypothetical protein